MGHVTIVGPSMGDVEERLKSILKEEGSDCQSAGNCTRVFSYLLMLVSLKEEGSECYVG